MTEETTKEEAKPAEAKPEEAKAAETKPAPRTNVPLSTLEVDNEVTSWCGKCKGFTVHKVKTLQPPKPPKSVCLTCRAVHQVRYTQPGTKKASSKDRPNLPPWSELTADAEVDLAPKYMVTGSFEYGDFIMHKNFGLGCIVEVLSDERIQVSFEEGAKQLIQNYSR